MQEATGQDCARHRKRDSLFAGIFSLIMPGLGQVYNGQMKRGVIIYVLLFVISLGMLAIGIQYTFSGLAAYLMLTIGFYIFAIIDAAYMASKRGDKPLKSYNKWQVYVLILLLNFSTNIITEDTIKNDLFVIDSYKLQSSGMASTILEGDLLMADINHYKTKTPKRGDIIVFKYPQEEDVIMIKRVIAIGGDTIESRDKIIYLNGEKIEEPYVIHGDDSNIIEKGESPPRDNFGPIEVPEDKLFVMGDNRDRSRDSRYWGFVDEEAVIGKALYLYWSKDSDRIGMEIR